MRIPLAVLLALSAIAQAAEPTQDSDRIAAETAQRYLEAATGHASRGKELLLGGVSMNAELLQLESADIVSKEPGRHEELTLASAVSHMEALDKAGRSALTQVIGKGGAGEDLSVRELTREEAQRLLAPTQEKAKRFAQDHPVLAYVIRTDREVYWHPKNPIRTLLRKAGKSGKYTLDLYLFKVRSLEGPTQSPRDWPLRVIRFKTAKIDTGWKVLPASDWSVD